MINLHNTWKFKLNDVQYLVQDPNSKLKYFYLMINFFFFNEAKALLEISMMILATGEWKMALAIIIFNHIQLT